MQVFQNLAGLVSKQQAKSPVNFKKHSMQAVGGSLPVISRSVRIPVLFDFQKDESQSSSTAGCPRGGCKDWHGPLAAVMLSRNKGKHHSQFWESGKGELETKKNSKGAKNGHVLAGDQGLR